MMEEDLLVVDVAGMIMKERMLLQFLDHLLVVRLLVALLSARLLDVKKNLSPDLALHQDPEVEVLVKTVLPLKITGNNDSCWLDRIE
jgi:hypothetical protein